MTVDPDTLRAALDRAAAEAHRIAEGLTRIDAALGALVQESDAAARSLQAADLLRQEVEGLSRFLAALAAQADPGARCDTAGVLSELALGAQAGRLGAVARVAEAEMSDDLWGLPQAAVAVR
ncbi:hypothetical protein [Paracoccus sp. ME4]|uniref:hypothetical protein n=1 Tax=Paracoccus sp. ME4 TaxID=3138066 RepID=UPI00398B82E8